MKVWMLAAVLGVMAVSVAQDVKPTAKAAGCCSVVTPAGQSLVRMLDGMDVNHRWLADRHVHWESGRPEGGVIMDGKPHTHCSAFAAAAGERLGIYMLRPPEHSQLFLASAQGKWFTTERAAARGLGEGVVAGGSAGAGESWGTGGAGLHQPGAGQAWTHCDCAAYGEERRRGGCGRSGDDAGGADEFFRRQCRAELSLAPRCVADRGVDVRACDAAFGSGDEAGI